MKLDSTNTFLTVVSLAMFSVTSVLVGLLVCGSSEPGPQCDPNSSELQCPDGTICNEFGQCIADVSLAAEAPLPDCEVGQALATCRCPVHLIEQDGVCREPPPELCEHADVAALLARLEQACSSERETAPGRLESCPQTALRDVILGSHQDTLNIAKVFRERSFTLHFHSGTPRPLESNRWPSDGEQQRIVSAIHKLLGEGRERGFLLLVSLASATGTRKINFELAARRSDAAVALIGRAREAFPDLDKAMLDVQLLVGLIGHEERTSLDLQTFDQIWGVTGRYRAWNEAETRHMHAKLESWRAGKISPYELQWLSRVVNQSVLVIPLPCTPSTEARHG